MYILYNAKRPYSGILEAYYQAHLTGVDPTELALIPEQVYRLVKTWIHSFDPIILPLKTNSRNLDIPFEHL